MFQDILTFSLDMIKDYKEKREKKIDFDSEDFESNKLTICHKQQSWISYFRKRKLTFSLDFEILYS